jgi:heme/copper-type cytochrome/quinol oxidase subunit 3
MAAPAVPALAAAPAAAPPRPRVLVVGTVAALIAASLPLLGIVGIYLARRADVINAGEEWFDSAVSLPLTQSTMILGTFALSLFSVAWLVDALKRDDRQHAYIAAALSLMFGLAIVNQGTYLLGNTGAEAATESGLLVLTITSYHLVLTLIGMGFLSVVFFRSLFGQYRKIPDGATAAATWWAGVSLLWVLIWYVVYVTK